MSKDEYFEGNTKINKIMFDSIKDKKYKSINLIYNHYYNVSRIERVKEQILPLEKNKANPQDYQDDFAVEGNINSILLNYFFLLALLWFRLNHPSSNSIIISDQYWIL